MGILRYSCRGRPGAGHRPPVLMVFPCIPVYCRVMPCISWAAVYFLGCRVLPGTFIPADGGRHQAGHYTDTLASFPVGD